MVPLADLGCTVAIDVPTIPPLVEQVLSIEPNLWGIRRLVRHLRERRGSGRDELVALARRVGGAAIPSVYEAIGQLGLPHTREILIAAALRPARAPLVGGSQVRQAWRRAVACAMWARLVGSMRAQRVPHAFLCGLFHGVGQVAMLHANPHANLQDARIQQEVRALSTAVARAWMLPAPVVAAAAHHHQFLRAPSYREHVAVTAMAGLLAGETLAEIPADGVPLDEHRVVRFLGLEGLALQRLRAQASVVDSTVAVLGTAP